MLYISNAECRFITTEHVSKKLSARPSNEYYIEIFSWTVPDGQVFKVNPSLSSAEGLRLLLRTLDQFL
jgi:hypothetical protein